MSKTIWHKGPPPEIEMKPVDWKAEYDTSVERHNQTLDELQLALQFVDAYKEKLDELGLAIVDAGYAWTPAMRTAYERKVKGE